MASDCHVICFGNELHGDDGFGPAVHARLADMRLPDGVRLFRADTSGIAALPLFEGCDRVLLVDAVSGFGAPGSIHTLPPEAIALEGASGHGFGIGGLLRIAAATLPTLPAIRLVVVETSRVTAFMPGLSPEVDAALPAAVDSIMEYFGDELARCA
ncbi:MAG TPA: hydrogenase maturation protease [Rhodocyclaceae bacterium]|nr:hydrogenase maturation protease [Rhodocyclaceae bacterium]HMV53382.1 hydrogenase maturation protease [Rhodocyclaceae bacterium]HMZ83932.1 hydrogenase maturation protease [Rhodocyclaceae bacterium]HNA03557.1 hydrogenase maturation protease [Rhodocyclaceae bacterium]HNB77641.1 hydrogenase maturation protease [Rhodocyclaceae bacterium]